MAYSESRAYETFENARDEVVALVDAHDSLLELLLLKRGLRFESLFLYSYQSFLPYFATEMRVPGKGI